jgi:tetratricopeptide (TPR) repeat protein/O-antigen ligase
VEETKLSAFCDKVIEAGWLLAAVMAPLFFDVYSSRVFEPDKITLVRSLAVLMCAAWIIRVLDSGLGTRAGGAESPADTAGDRWYVRLAKRNALAWPTLFLVLAYIVSTIFSVSPVVSVWGSYQRLQGTYSTFSYIIIFALLCGTMRRRDQVERLITIMLFTSVPSALYGLVQHNKLEFLPWAGDVTTRVTSSMGNAIFIAAWLVMVVPLTIARFVDAAVQLWTDHSAPAEDKNEALSGQAWVALAVMQGVALYVLLYQLLRFYAASRQTGEVVGSLDAGLLVLSLGAIILPFFLGIRGHLASVLGAAAYLFLLMLQLTTIWFSGSRGPLLGLMAGLFVFAIMFTVMRRLRRTFYAAIGLALAGAVFLGVFNLPNTPLEPLKSIPYVGRLGSFLETESGTGKVRVLIWEGAIQLIKAEPLRTLIGWGPESMYVAYNRFYPPDLAHYEARNASPDRSHNETYDSLVITGILGFLAYWTAFYTFFYHALNLLGLVRANHRRWLYGALLATGIVAFALLYAEVLPLPASPIFPLLGVAVLGVYLVFFVGDFFKTPPPSRSLGIYQTRILVIFAAVLAHFVEIQFGIAIASTRTYFWLYLGLTVVIGMLMARETTPRPAEVTIAASATEPLAISRGVKTSPDPNAKSRIRKARQMRATPAASSPAVAAVDWWPVTTYALLAAIVLVTMIYDFVVPQPQGTPATVLALIFCTWLFTCLVTLLSVRYQSGGAERILKSFLISSLVTWAVVVTFSLLHPVRFVSPTANLDPSQFISYFYVWIGILLLALAVTLYFSEKKRPARLWQGLTVGWAYPLLVGVAIFVVVTTNLNVIIADIYYKTGDAYDQSGQWDRSIPAYQKALNLAPSQDFYYLFLGRAFMELAKRVPDAQRAAATYTVSDLMSMRPEQVTKMSRLDMLNASLTSLLEARRLNPLNTDHTANLARLYRFWGEVSDPAMLDKAISYYREATTISPNTAHLYDEWSLVYFIRGQYEDALSKLNQSIALDTQYPPTYVYLGDVYQALNRPQEALQSDLAAVKLDPGALINPNYFSRQDTRLFDMRLAYFQQNGMLDSVVSAFQDAIAKDVRSFSAHYTLGYIYFVQGKSDEAVNEMKQAVALNHDDIASHGILGYIYAQQGKLTEAVQENLEVVRLAPNDRVSHSNLAFLYQRLGLLTRAISETQTALRLPATAQSPTDQALQDLLTQLQQQLGQTGPAAPVAPPAPGPQATPTPKK